MKLTALGYGPIIDTTVIDMPPGGCVIEGPSRVGKTTVMNLVALALWGKQADGSDVNQKFIHERAAIRVDLDTAVVRVAVSAGPRWNRRISTADVNDLSLQSQQDLARHLDNLNPEGQPGSRWDVGLTVMSPTRWVSLYQDGQRGRSLRDLLTKVLPAGDLVGTVAALLHKAGDEIRLDGRTADIHPLLRGEKDETLPSDPMHLQDVRAPGAKSSTLGALSLQTAANTAETRASAERAAAAKALAEAQATVKEIERTTPTEEEVSSARAVINAVSEWQAYDVECGRYERDLRAYNISVDRVARYDAERAALGEAPVIDEVGEAAAKSAWAKAIADVDAARDALATANADLAAAQATEAAERKAEQDRIAAAHKAEQERVAAAERAEREKQEALAAMQAKVDQQRKEEEERRAREAAKPKPVVAPDPTVPLFAVLPPVYIESNLPTGEMSKPESAVLDTTTNICPTCGQTRST